MKQNAGMASERSVTRAHFMHDDGLYNDSGTSDIKRITTSDNNRALGSTTFGREDYGLSDPPPTFSGLPEPPSTSTVSHGNEVDDYAIPDPPATSGGGFLPPP
ncbi:hypothetical protein SLA2020_308880 [Shorea laevis]